MRFSEVILRGTRALQSAANSVPIGTLYYVTDEFITERSNGTSWDTFSDGAGNANVGIALVRRALTKTELEGMNATPIQLVAAQGADKIVLPVLASLEQDVTAAYANNPTQSIIWAGDSVNLINATFAMPFNTINKRFSFFPVAASYTQRLLSTFDPRNKALQIKANADLSGTTGNVTAVLIVQYTILKTTV